MVKLSAEKIKNELSKKEVNLAIIPDYDWVILGTEKDLHIDDLNQVDNIIREEVSKGNGVKISEEDMKTYFPILLSDDDKKIRLETSMIISRIRTIIPNIILPIKNQIQMEKEKTVKSILCWTLAINEEYPKEKSIKLLKDAINANIQHNLRFELLIMLLEIEGYKGDAEKILSEMVIKKELKQWQFCEYKLKIQELVFFDIIEMERIEIDKHFELINEYITKTNEVMEMILEAKESYEEMHELEKIKIQANSLMLQYQKRKIKLTEMERRMNILSQYQKIAISKKETLWEKWGGEIIGVLIGAIIGGLIAFLITYFVK